MGARRGCRWRYPSIVHPLPWAEPDDIPGGWLCDQGKCLWVTPWPVRGPGISFPSRGLSQGLRCHIFTGKPQLPVHQAAPLVHPLLHKHQTTQPCPYWQDPGVESSLAFKLNVKGQHPENPLASSLGDLFWLFSVSASDLWHLTLDSHPTSMKGCWWLSYLNYRFWPSLQDPIKCLYKYRK